MSYGKEGNWRINNTSLLSTKFITVWRVQRYEWGWVAGNMRGYGWHTKRRGISLNFSRAFAAAWNYIDGWHAKNP